MKTTTTNGRATLPTDPEAERALLGAVLHPNGERHFDAVAKLVGPADFFDDKLRRIFRTRFELHDKGKPFDHLLMVREMKAEGDDQKDIAATILELIDRTPTPEHATHYAERVREVSRKRQLALLGYGLADDAANGKSSGDILCDLGATVSDMQRVEVRDDVICLAEVEPAKTTWLWDRRIPVGSITLLEADPATGKSQITADLTARATTGRPMPPYDGNEGTYSPVSAIILSAEDSPAQTIRPRLDAAQADVSRCFCLKRIEFPSGIQKLRQTIERIEARLVIVDPVNAYIDGDIDSHNDASTRRVMSALSELAEEAAVAIVGIRHLNKSGGQKAMYRGSGSIAFIAAARSVLTIGPDPNEPEERILASVKSNLCKPPVPLAYRIESAGNVSRVVWIGERPYMTADKLHTPPMKTKINLDEQLEADRKLVVGALRKGDNTATGIRERCALNGARVRRALDSLEEEGDVSKCKINKTGRDYDGYKLSA